MPMQEENKPIDKNDDPNSASSDIFDPTSESVKDPKRSVLFASAKYIGPLPPAEQFKVYEETYPGTAIRILAYMEKEQANRHSMDAIMIQSMTRETTRGQLLAWSIMVLLIVAAVICGLQGHDFLAGCFLVGASFGVVTKFIDGRAKENTPSKNVSTFSDD
jgi:uncharacterized membrane protein